LNSKQKARFKALLEEKDEWGATLRKLPPKTQLRKFS